MLAPRSPGVAALVLMLVVLPVVSMDLQFAAMPDIARAMDASVAAVQATLSAFAGVFGVLQLAYGPVSDRLGRKPLIVGGMLLFGAASIGCVLAESVAVLTVMRVLQAVGACAGPVLGRAAIRDVHGAQGAAQVLGYVMAAFGVIAIIGPFLGGVLVDLFDWRANFIGMAIFGFVAAGLCWLLLPETRPEIAAGETGNPPRSRTRALIATFGRLLGTRQVVVFIIAGGLMQGAFFGWLAGSSFVIMEVFGYSGTVYGLILPVTVLGFVGSSFLTGRLAGKLPYHRLMIPGVLIGSGAGIAGLVLTQAGFESLWAVLTPVMVLAVAHGITLSQSAAGAMAPYPEHAGAASALAGFFQYLGITISVLLNGLLFDGSARPMMALIAALATASALIYLSFARSIAARAAA